MTRPSVAAVAADSGLPVALLTTPADLFGVDDTETVMLDPAVPRDAPERETWRRWCWARFDAAEGRRPSKGEKP